MRPRQFHHLWFCQWPRNSVKNAISLHTSVLCLSCISSILAGSLIHALTIEATCHVFIVSHAVITLYPPCLASLCDCAVHLTSSTVCIYLAMKSAAGHTPSATVFLFMHFFELYEVVGSKCDCNLVNVFVNCNGNCSYMNICH